MDNEKIGLFIANLRKEKDLTQKELGNKIGVTDRAVSRWERGIGCPDISLLDDLSNVLDVSILELLKGRRLNSNEVLESKDLIESMSFTKNNITKNIKKISNYIAITIFIIIISLLGFFNIKSFYYMNKTYSRSDMFIDNNIFSNIDSRVDLILSNKGIFTDEEYNIIKNYVNAIKDLSNPKQALKFINKEKFTYKELLEYKDSISIYAITGYEVDFNEKVYQILVKYNINKLDNMINFSRFKNICLETFVSLELDLTLNNSYISKDIVNTLNIITTTQYKLYNTILDDIIEVGGMHE